MKVNPDKFNAIIFGKNECVNLTFSDIAVKSMDSRQVNNALCRLRNVASKESKFIMHKTYIISNFNYCSTIS